MSINVCVPGYAVYVVARLQVRVWASERESESSVLFLYCAHNSLTLFDSNFDHLKGKGKVMFSLLFFLTLYFLFCFFLLHPCLYFPFPVILFA